MPCEPCQQKMNELERKLAEANSIIQKCLSIAPVGYIPNHTPENLPRIIEDLAREVGLLSMDNDKLEDNINQLKLKLDFMEN